MVQVNAGFP